MYFFIYKIHTYTQKPVCQKILGKHLPIKRELPRPEKEKGGT